MVLYGKFDFRIKDLEKYGYDEKICKEYTFIQRKSQKQTFCTANTAGVSLFGLSFSEKLFEDIAL